MAAGDGAGGVRSRRGDAAGQQAQAGRQKGGARPQAAGSGCRHHPRGDADDAGHGHPFRAPLPAAPPPPRLRWSAASSVAPIAYFP